MTTGGPWAGDRISNPDQPPPLYLNLAHARKVELGGGAYGTDEFTATVTWRTGAVETYTGATACAIAEALREVALPRPTEV